MRSGERNSPEPHHDYGKSQKRCWWKPRDACEVRVGENRADSETWVHWVAGSVLSHHLFEYGVQAVYGRSGNLAL
jgi:hypothetical protein